MNPLLRERVMLFGTKRPYQQFDECKTVGEKAGRVLCELGVGVSNWDGLQLARCSL